MVLVAKTIGADRGDGAMNALQAWESFGLDCGLPDGGRDRHAGSRNSDNFQKLPARFGRSCVIACLVHVRKTFCLVDSMFDGKSIHVL